MAFINKHDILIATNKKEVAILLGCSYKKDEELEKVSGGISGCCSEVACYNLYDTNSQTIFPGLYSESKTFLMLYVLRVISFFYSIFIGVLFL